MAIHSMYYSGLTLRGKSTLLLGVVLLLVIVITYCVYAYLSSPCDAYCCVLCESCLCHDSYSMQTTYDVIDCELMNVKIT